MKAFSWKTCKLTHNRKKYILQRPWIWDKGKGEGLGPKKHHYKFICGLEYHQPRNAIDLGINDIDIKDINGELDVGRSTPVTSVRSVLNVKNDRSTKTKLMNSCEQRHLYLAKVNTCLDGCESTRIDHIGLKNVSGGGFKT